MVADDDDQRTRPDPGAGGGNGIKIVDGAAARIPAAECVLRRAVGAFRKAKDNVHAKEGDHDTEKEHSRRCRIRTERRP